MRFGLVLVLLALFVGSVLAVPEFTGSLQTGSMSVRPGDEATFILDVQNLAGENQRVAIDLLSLESTWYSLSEGDISLGPKETKTVEIRISVPMDAVRGNRGFFVSIRDVFNQSNKVRLQGQFEVFRETGMTMNGSGFESVSYAPGEVAVFPITVRNLEATYLLGFRLHGTFTGREGVVFENTVEVPTLDSGKSHTEFFRYQLPEDAIGSYSGKIELINPAETVIQEGSGEFTVPAVEKITRNQEVTGNPLFSERRFIVRNTGNVVAETDVVDGVTGISAWVAFGSGAEAKRSIGSVDFVWKITLRPGEERVVSDTVHSWALYVIALLVIALVGLAYNEFRMPTIVKYAQKSEGMHVVTLHISNSSAKPMVQTVVRERIPGMYSVVVSKDGIKPNSVKKEEDINVLEYRLGNLKPREERLIAYRLKGKIEVEGDVRLEAAEITFRKGGEEVTRRSNFVTLVHETRRTAL